MIEYTTERKFSQKQVEDLFKSIGWVSGEFPIQLYQALIHSSYVLSAWDGSQLVGLIRGLDDGGMTAFLHYLLVSPNYRGQGIASEMVKKAKEHYANFFYINIMPEESKNAPFYERLGFKRMPDGVAMQICNKKFGQ